jgi:hypothetical protein
VQPFGEHIHCDQSRCRLQRLSDNILLSASCSQRNVDTPLHPKFAF